MGQSELRYISIFQILRIQSPEGTKRIEIDKSETTITLYERVHDVFNLTGYRFVLYKEKGHKGELVSSKSKTLVSCGLKHGDMIYMTPSNGTLMRSAEAGSSESNTTNRSSMPGTSGRLHFSGNGLRFVQS